MLHNTITQCWNELSYLYALFTLCLISRLTHFPFSWFCMSLPSGYFVSRDPKSKLVVKFFIWHKSSAQQIQRGPLLNCYYPFSINLMFWLVRISFRKFRALVIRVLTTVFVMARENHISKVLIILIYTEYEAAHFFDIREFT